MTSHVFFQSHGDHADLHSFPTRRSSDLAVGRSEGSRDHAASNGRQTGDTKCCAGSKPSDDVSFHDVALQKNRRDRKSTRLNSSHPSISYAVFCLKKKNNPTAPSSTR